MKSLLFITNAHRLKEEHNHFNLVKKGFFFISSQLFLANISHSRKNVIQ